MFSFQGDTVVVSKLDQDSTECERMVSLGATRILILCCNQPMVLA